MRLTRDQFVSRYGGIYEHSAWVAEQSWDVARGIADTDQLAEILARSVDQASRDRKLALIRAHPDLAGKAAVAGGLTEESTGEQAAAGIDRCTPDEFEQFQALNRQYKQKFGFPFVMAVRNSNKTDILGAFAQRLQNETDTEFAKAISEIHKIARLRIEAQLVNDQNENPFHAWVRLEQPRLGSRVVYATDEFFAAKERLIEPREAVFIDGKYDDHGKWMDGWESRRKRIEGYDHCVVRFGIPGIVHGVDIDTSFFTGNYPPSASIDACVSAATIPDDGTEWQEILPAVDLQGDAHHLLAIDNDNAFTHLRLNIFPDGGVARLRVYGEVRPDWHKVDSNAVIDLFAIEHGGRAVLCSDQHYGTKHNLNFAGRGVDMGDGWETARRRGPGNDWVVLRLGHPGHIDKVEIDTAHFKGNYPDRAEMRAALVSDERDLAAASANWPLLLAESKLDMDMQHHFSDTLQDLGAVSHVRLNIFPDGGISRVRLFGTIAAADGSS